VVSATRETKGRHALKRAAKSLTADYADNADSSAGGSIATDLHRWNTDVERENPTAIAAALRAATILYLCKSVFIRG
jgi:hypothetical protein